MRRYRQIASKALKTKAMLQNETLSRYIPFTAWFSEESLQRMLTRFPVVVVKPDKGGGGSGIIRITRGRGGRCEVCFRTECRSLGEKEWIPVVKKLMIPGKPYLVQQGIRLAKIDGRPFDIRILLQKPQKKWVLSGMVAKLAARGQFVTNYCKGGRPRSVPEVLEKLFGGNRIAISRVTDEMKYLSKMTAKVLDQRFPGLRELGLDVGIDTDGGIWIFEVNTRPQFQLFRKIKDKSMYREIMKHHRSVI